MKVVCPGCDAVNNVDPEHAGEPKCGRCKETLEPRAPGYPLETDDAHFETDVLRAGLPVLVDFWAPWCGPCRALAPHLNAFARQVAGKVRVVKLNTQQNQMIPNRYKIRGIPTMILFRGIEAGRFSGLTDAQGLMSFVQRYVEFD